jgi:hypothetical protein
MTRDLFELTPGFREKWRYAARYAPSRDGACTLSTKATATLFCSCTAIQPGGFLYRDVIGPLVQSGRRVVVLDMIGFGHSERPTRERARVPIRASLA